MLPTLKEFLQWKFPLNSYIEHSGFETLYVRSQSVFISMNGETFRCHPVVQIGNVTATNPGNGAFSRLVEEIISLDRAVYVENVLNERFGKKLLRMGFVEVNKQRYTPCYIFNFEGKLHEYSV